MGHKVEVHTRSLFPDGIGINHSVSIDQITSDTLAAIRTHHKPIYNALICAADLLSEIDIMVPARNNSWDIYEVKSCTTLDDDHLAEITWERHVAECSGLVINKAYLVLIDNTFIRHGELEPKKLFKIIELGPNDWHPFQLPIKNFNAMEYMVGLLREQVKRKEMPKVKVCGHCPDCALQKSCYPDVDVYGSIFSLYRLGKRAFDLFHNGVTKIADLPNDFAKKNHTQRVQMEAEQLGKPIINHNNLRGFLRTIKPPTYFLDFESMSSPLCPIDRSSPFDQIPFQFALIIAGEDGSFLKHSWIWDGTGDPRLELLARIKVLLGDSGSVVVYNVSFERRILKSCVKLYPEYADWLTSLDRHWVDLLEPFRSFNVYYPAQKGSCSLKSVLPALTGRSYDGLVIQDGLTASIEYMRVMFPETGQVVAAEDKSATLAHLEEYCCGLDTMGMVYILDALKKLVEPKNRKPRKTKITIVPV